jgi:ComF family protein
MPDSVLCVQCADRVVVPAVLYKTIASYVVPIHAVSIYQPPIQSLVWAKERKQIHAARQLGMLLAHYSRKRELVFDCIIPVPLHWTRRCARGYNQAWVMGKTLQAQYPQAIVLQPFRRCRATQFQRLLDATARQENVKNSFVRSYWWSEQACVQALAGKKIVLIDDVYTTGATIEVLINAVAQYKPHSIMVLTGCRVA